MKSLRVPMPIQILAMIVSLSLGGALVLFGQLTPSEESDWPWKVVTEADVFLNGAPAGSLSDLTVLEESFGALVKQGRRSGKWEDYETPQVLVVADPDISIGLMATIADVIETGSGEPILVSKRSLEKVSKGSKPNPRAIVVTTDNSDSEMIERSAYLKDTELYLSGHRVAFLSSYMYGDMPFARTYESSIEIGSDGSYYVNERTAQLEARESTNVEQRLMLSDDNRVAPVAPLRQRAVPRAELQAALAKLVSIAEKEGEKILIIASDKARYGSLLQVLDGLDSEERVVVLVRVVEIR